MDSVRVLGFGSMTDWTALDPAIVSFRQFPFKSSPMNPTPQTQPQHPLYNTGDMLMSHHQQQNHNMHQGKMNLNLFVAIVK